MYTHTDHGSTFNMRQAIRTNSIARAAGARSKKSSCTLGCILGVPDPAAPGIHECQPPLFMNSGFRVPFEWHSIFAIQFMNGTETLPFNRHS